MNKINTLLFLGSLYLFAASAMANSIFDSLSNGHFSGEMHSVLSISSTPEDAIRETGIDSSAKSGSSAFSLAYQSQDYQGWSIGGRLQLGIDWNLHDEKSGSSLFGGEDDIRITVDGLNLQNFYIEYDLNHHGTNTQFTIGRQDIISPLVMRSGLFPMMDAFEGLVVTNQDYANTKIQLMVLDGWFKREEEFYGALGSIPQRLRFDKPVMSLYLKSSAVESIDFEAQWMSNDNDDLLGDPPTAISTFGGYDAFYLAADYKIKDSYFTLGGQYKLTNYKDNEKADFFGVRGRFDSDKYSIEISYTKNSDDANSPGTLGHVPWLRSYNYSISVNDIFAGVSTLNSKLVYDFGIDNLTTSIKYSWISQTVQGQSVSGRNLDNAQQVAMDLRYNFVKIEELSLRLELAHTAYNDVFDNNDFVFSRASVKYQF